MKRLICTIAIIAAFSISAQAKYSGGSGISGDPYQIATAADLVTLGADTNNYDKCFILTADIALGAFTNSVIAPDTDSSTTSFDGPKFTGLFNGAWHKISGLQINGDGLYYIGLFGAIGSTGFVENLRLENITIHGLNSVGGLAGINQGIIRYCSSSGHVTSGDYSEAVGGLVGYEDGTIYYSSSTATVSGGIYSGSLGGLAGSSTNDGLMSQCYATGTVTGGDNSYDLGGLVGENYYGSISQCYSAGAVTSGSNSTYLGGLVGYNDTGNISHSYFLKNAGPDNTYGVALTSAQMKKQASFVGLIFGSIWQISAGDYPTLVWQSTIPVEDYIQTAKCTVAAGSGSKGDSISFSGTMNATADDFNDANNSSNANFVKVTISPEDANYSRVITFPVNGKTWKKGAFSYSGTVNGVKKSFSYAVKTGKYSLSVSNIDLSGLECPLTIDINVGGFDETADIDESIVNGTKPMPINLFMGVKNSLRVDKSKFTKKSGNITQVSVSGGFSDKNANDTNLVTNQLDVNVGSQTFTIPAANFKNTKGKFTCSNVSITGGVASATFDFNKCTFTLTIKNTSFPADSGTADFKLEFGDFSESDDVILP